MGTWSYQHAGHQTAGCTDPDGVELSVGSCDGASADIAIRHPADGTPGDVIASIHLPSTEVADMAEALARYSGPGALDAMIGRLVELRNAPVGDEMRRQ